MPWNIVGHEWAVQMLTRAAAGRPAHAYLFTGPAQIGKRTLALEFARALNCTGANPPCGQCRNCTQIAAGQHPDVRIIQRAPDKSEIVVEQLRDVQNELTLRPYSARWRVALIVNVQEANVNAANAFLKTLEEPAPQVVLLLTASHPEAVLQTIRSRCQIIPLRPLPLRLVEQTLAERTTLEEMQARLLARLSGGRVGWAIDASQEEMPLAQRSVQLQGLLDTLPLSRAGRIELAGKLTRAEGEVMPALDLWLSWWRDLLLVKGECAGAIVNVDQSERLSRDAERLPLDVIQQYIGVIQNARQQIEMNVNVRLAVEMMLLSAPMLAAPGAPVSLHPAISQR
jgi:DNA polymerase III subunit delta'